MKQRQALEQRQAPAVQTPVDAVETQGYDATQVAMDLQQISSPIVIADTLPPEETSPCINRSLARDFSNANLEGWVS